LKIKTTAMSILTNCFDDLPAYQLNPCEVDKLSGIGELAIIDLDHTFTDFSDPAQWAAEEALGNVRILKGIQAEYAAGEAVNATQARARGAENKLVKLNHTLSWVDQNVSDQNDQFYEKLNVRTAFLVWHYFEENEIRIQAAYPCQFLATNPIAVNNEFQRYEVSATWRSSPDVFPVLSPAPTGVF
jgi:hypothetical protein